MDVVFEKNPNFEIYKREILTPILLTEGTNLSINVPTINSILGDKLCAFAPNTTGISYNSNKEMEIIKQMFDVSCLIDEFDDQKTTFEVYKNALLKNLNLEGNHLHIKSA